MKTDNKINIKIYIIIIFGILVLAAAYFLIYERYHEDKKQGIIEGAKNNTFFVGFIIDYNNGTITKDTIGLDMAGRTEPYTAFEILNSSYDINSTYWASVGGYFVNCIDGVCSYADESMNSYWFFFVNGKLAEVGVNAYYLRDKDIITMNYTYRENVGM